MPGDMDGFQLAEWTQQNFPETKILLLSGYTRRQGAENTNENISLIRKPYAHDVLVEALRSALESQPKAVGDA